MKLKTRIHVFTTLLMFIILAAVSIGVYFLFADMMYDRQAEQLRARGEELTVSLNELTPLDDRQQVVRAYTPPTGAILVADDKGKNLILADTDKRVRGFKPETDPDKPYTLTKVDGTTALTVSLPYIDPAGGVATIHVTQLSGDIEHNLSLLRWILIGILSVAMIAVFASSVALGRIVTLPIDRLTRTMRANREDGTYEKIEGQNGRDELYEMTLAYNDMMDRLGRNYEKQERFVSDASHELKTPITVIESYARLLKRRGFDDRAVADEAVGAILSEAVRMKMLTQQLLDLARSDKADSYKFERADVRVLAEEAVRPMRQTYNREFSIEGPDHAIAETDPEKLKQILFILLDNARKYSDGPVKVTIEDSGGPQLIVSVADHGSGIPEEARPHLFDRFYRVGSDRNRKTGGTGLGLALAKEISKGLGAELTAESVIGVGSVFRIGLPKEQGGGN
ncbi:sensor histidine kinase [Edaphobacillus lindanitolerans]|uniref:histidine kinase n=1 Tax=Edaphobacillus lindanitolerans TaxID=550447 RepID=A0A1U7PP22_9BACI|nr:HAMP domain-containing sensor histidine kinase [Edaphobacillus lindanitolerans]SIT74661.1 Signal transduction histidine kinase [Edaphobacillus lindanitolerans]